MRSLGQPALLKTFEVWQRMSEAGAVHQAHCGPDLTHSSQLEAEVGRCGLLASLVHTRNIQQVPAVHPSSRPATQIHGKY